MRIAVYGCGGVGGYFGGRLAQIGQDVTFIARNKNLQALRNRGLIVDSIAGDFHINKVQVSDNPAETGVVDYVLCCVKAWQIPAAARAMKPLIGPDTLVIPLQNGVEAPQQLATEIEPAQVLGGLCGIIVFQAGPGHIKHSGANPLIRFGHLDRHDRFVLFHSSQDKTFTVCCFRKQNSQVDKASFGNRRFRPVDNANVFLGQPLTIFKRSV